MMNRFETTVRMLIACLIAATLSGAVYAETSDSEKSSTRSCSSEVEAINKLEDELDAELQKSAPSQDRIKRLNERVAAAQKRYEECNGVNSNNTADCSKSKGQYNTARGALAGACLTLGGGNSGESGWPLCTKAIVQCDVCPSESEEGADRRSELNCQETGLTEEEDAAAGTPDSAFGLRNLNTGKDLLKYCPGKLGAEQKDLEKQMTEAQKEVRRLESELPKMQAEYAALVSKGEEDMLASQEKMTSAQTELDNQMLELQNTQEDAVKAITEQISQTEEQIRRADDSIRQVELSKVDIENAYTEAVTGYHLQCHASALQTVSKYQQDRLQLERANQYNQASFNAMMKNVGVSDRAQWQRIADKYYNWCLQSKPTKDSENSALKVRNSALAKAQEAITKLEGDKTALRAQIKKMKDDNGCAPSAQNPTDMCRTMQRFQRQAESYQRQYNTKMNQANAEMATKQRTNAAEQQAKMAEATLVQQQLAEERTRMNNLKQYLELAYQAGGGMTSGEAKNYIGARDKFGEFVSAASIYASCNSQGDCQADSMCREAADFLINYGTPPSYNDSATKTGDTTVEPETPRTATDAVAPSTDDAGAVTEGDDVAPTQVPLTEPGED